ARLCLLLAFRRESRTRQRRADVHGTARGHGFARRRLDGGARCGVYRCSGIRSFGRGTWRRQHWDRVWVSGFYRRNNLRATGILRATSSLLFGALCRLRPAAGVQASLPPPRAPLSLLLLLPLTHLTLWPRPVSPA